MAVFLKKTLSIAPLIICAIFHASSLTTPSNLPYSVGKKLSHGEIEWIPLFSPGDLQWSFELTPDVPSTFQLR